ncbi:hypothetical protein RAS1_10240 [Phycisphaerae bacterium RAS1]|nr:hypothetical protein RAS1_10240 [Phycisphaerae bacterium RAS1]
MTSEYCKELLLLLSQSRTRPTKSAASFFLSGQRAAGWIPELPWHCKASGWAICVLVALGLLLPTPVRADDALITSTPVVDVRPAGEGWLLTLAAAPDLKGAATRVLLADGATPLGWLTRVNAPAGACFFLRRFEPPPPGALRAWLLRPTLVRELQPRWPLDAPLLAAVDAAAPGWRTVWLRAGAEQGVRVGDTWWSRSAGQPVARFEVLAVEADLCLCCTVALASDLPLHSIQSVALWPSPARRRLGEAMTAVCMVEAIDDGARAWVAAPRGVRCPADAHIDFFQSGRYVTHGVVEKRDDRFWYVRVVSPHSAVADVNGEGTVPEGARPDLIRVGDNARIRTDAEISQRRFAARIFRLTDRGGLINAGEADRLEAGEIGRVIRDGAEVGQILLQRVQRDYSMVEPAAAFGDLELATGDVVRFGPSPRPAVPIGRIVSIVGETAFVLRLEGTAAPLLTPLTIRSGGRSVGAALLLTADGGKALGVAVPESLPGALEEGMDVVLDE